MAKVDVPVPDDLMEWLEGQVTTLRYVDAGDYIVHIIRDYKNYWENRTRLTEEIEDGLHSAEADVSFDQAWRDAKLRMRALYGHGDG
ncbi:MAG: hypothetical protein MI723_18050 [Caulobacterales bacterium]|nr:hypothetical protein [Caulobacterales bacterium]